MVRKYFRVAAAFSIFFSSNSNGGAQDICTGILSYTGRDQVTEARDNAVAQSIYKQYCSGSSIRSTDSTSVGLEAVVKAIPIKFSFGGNSSKEKLSNFCKTYDSRFNQYYSEQIDRSTVVQSSVNAFVQCVDALSRDIYFAPQLGRTKLSVDIRRGSVSAQLQGVSYDENILSCQIPDPSGGGLVKADKKTVRTLDDNYLPIACDRVPQPSSDGTQNYPATELQVITNRSVFLLPVAADALLSEKWATELSSRTYELEKRQTALEEREKTFEVSVGGGRIIAFVDVRDGKIIHSTPGVTYTVTGIQGIVQFPNPKGLEFVPILTDMGRDNNLIFGTNYVHKSYDPKSNSFVVSVTALDTGGRSGPPERFIAVAIGLEKPSTP